MVATNFSAALKIILREEGGNDDDPRDPGGRTSRGIIQREWDAYRSTHPGRPEDVWNALQSDVEAIYKEQYWDPYCDGLPAGLDLCFFNASVNSGRQQAVRELQRALDVNVDGMMGMLTKQAIAQAPNLKELIGATCDARRTFYEHLKTFSTFGKGWMARTDRVEKAAMAMADGAPAPNTLPADSTPKAKPADKAQPPLSTTTATNTTVAGGLGSLIMDQLKQIGDALGPLQDTFVWAKYICIAVMVAGAAFTIYSVIHDKKVQAAV